MWRPIPPGGMARHSVPERRASSPSTAHGLAVSSWTASLVTGQDPLQGTSAFSRHANAGAIVVKQAGSE